MTDQDDDLSNWAREVDALIDQRVAELDREIGGLAQELAGAGLDSPEAIRRAYDEMDASEREALARELGAPAPAPAPLAAPQRASVARRLGRLI